MAQTSILLLETDPTAGKAIREVLTPAGYVIDTVSDADEALRQAPSHELIVIDVADVAGGQEVCRHIRETQPLAGIPILAIAADDDVELRIKFLESGSDDVMARPFDGRELEARVEALVQRFRRSKGLAPALPAFAGGGDDPRRFVVVFSPKGGAGTTTIAVNLATAAAATRVDHVAIVDLDLQFGQVATHLNVTAQQTLAELSRDEQAIREPELVRGYATRHESGLHVFAAPSSPELSELLTAEQVRHLVGTLRQAFEITVVDAGSRLDERVLTLFEAADAIVVPIYPEIAALKALHSLVEYLTELGNSVARMVVVANHVFAREMLKMRDVESALGTKVSAELPYDPIVYLKAVNEGIPVVTGAARSEAAQKLLALAGTVIPDASGAADQPPAERRVRRFGTLLRRA